MDFFELCIGCDRIQANALTFKCCNLLFKRPEESTEDFFCTIKLPSSKSIVSQKPTTRFSCLVIFSKHTTPFFNNNFWRLSRVVIDWTPPPIFPSKIREQSVILEASNQRDGVNCSHIPWEHWTSLNVGNGCQSQISLVVRQSHLSGWFGLSAENFGLVVRTYKCLLPFCGCTWGGGSICRWWRHLTTICGNQTFLWWQVVGTLKPSITYP